jgi:asparagine synthetase B (glutamine-hydrolysing)
VQSIPGGLLVLDGIEGGAASGAWQLDAGVAGRIRLDRRHLLIEALGDPRVRDADDATLVLSAIQRWGQDGALPRLEGDYAFVYWDRRQRALSLVRDLFGVRRLHYALGPELVVFSTEIEGILAWPQVDPRPDEVAVLDMLLGRCQTTRRTFFSAIRRVLPGHSISFRADRIDESRWGTPPVPERTFTSFEEGAEGFRAAFEESVKDRLPGRGKVVCHLSGGLDSSAVAAVAATQLRAGGRREDLLLATARFPGLQSDEGPAARELAQWIGLPLHEWDGRAPEMSDLERPRRAWPFGRSSIAGSRQGDLELAGRQGATVVLSGQGGNQVTFESGYLQDALRVGMGPYLRGLLDLLRHRIWRWERRHRASVLQEARSAVRGSILRLPPVPHDDPLLGGMPGWLGPRLRRAWFELQDEARATARLAGPGTGSLMTDIVWTMTADDAGQVWTLEHEDARGVECGVEFRFPFLSRSLLAVVLSIPWHLRAPSSRDRSLMRRALRGAVPDPVLARDTFIAFNESNMRNAQQASGWIASLLSDGTWCSEGLVDREAVRSELWRLSKTSDEPFTYGHGDAWRRIRDIAAVEAWLRQF